MPLTLEYKICASNNNQTLKDFLKQQNLSKKAIVAIKHQGGNICVNGRKQTTRAILKTGDLVGVTFPDEQVSSLLQPLTMPLEIIYEDDFLLVINKSAGLATLPTGNHDISLANGILAYYQKIGLSSTVHFINRLDKDTSGLLVVAKYRHIQHQLTRNLKTITRKYYALVRGILKTDGLIDAPIARLNADSVKRVVHPSGKRAITHYEVVKHYLGSTLIKCTLKTGRTHQIRVHMSHLGYPIVNDPLYGDGNKGDMQLLHSYFLAFTHPLTGELLSFETAIGQRFEHFIKCQNETLPKCRLI